jgi:hypothetical protein
MASIFEQPKVDNPCTKYLKWSSLDACFLEYNKETGENVKHENLEFTCIKDMVTLKGYSEKHASSLWANEVENLKTQSLNIYCKIKDNKTVLISGLYADIKADAKELGAKYTQSVYIAVDVDGTTEIWNLQMTGSGREGWFDFTKTNKAFNGGKVVFTGFEKRGKTKAVTYNVPTFKLQANDNLENAKIEGKKVMDYIKSYLTASQTSAKEEVEPELVISSEDNDDLPF